jgi:hypothetical protein
VAGFECLDKDAGASCACLKRLLQRVQVGLTYFNDAIKKRTQQVRSDRRWQRLDAPTVAFDDEIDSNILVRSEKH